MPVDQLKIRRSVCPDRCEICKKCSDKRIVKVVPATKEEFYRKYIVNHQFNTAVYCMEFAERLGLSGKDKEILVKSAFLHDVGKLAIKEETLMKNGMLTEEERGEIKRHSIFGAVFLAGRYFDEEVVNVILSHHERVDGSGYPYGLVDKEIPYLAKVLSVCDAFEAMVSGRHYKKALNVGVALNELINNVGRQFDEEVVRMFVELIGDKRKTNMVYTGSAL